MYTVIRLANWDIWVSVFVSVSYHSCRLEFTITWGGGMGEGEWGDLWVSFAEFGFDFTIAFAIFHFCFLFLHSGAILEHSALGSWLNGNWRHVIDGSLFADCTNPPPAPCSSSWLHPIGLIEQIVAPPIAQWERGAQFTLAMHPLPLLLSLFIINFVFEMCLFIIEPYLHSLTLIALSLSITHSLLSPFSLSLSLSL